MLGAAKLTPRTCFRDGLDGRHITADQAQDSRSGEDPLTWQFVREEIACYIRVYTMVIVLMLKYIDAIDLLKVVPSTPLPDTPSD